MKERVILFWSGGKDSALTLHELQQDPEFEVASLLTTVTEGHGRIGAHRVRTSLLHRQQQSLGIPLCEVPLPENPTNERYERGLKKALKPFQEEGVKSVAFGDLFLEDIKAYRERLFSALGMACVFPLWKRDTRRLANRLIDSGFGAVTICIDLDALDGSFLGRELNREFLQDLPPAVDPCGENGEFHTFVYRGPVFEKEVRFSIGGTSSWGSYCFCDLLPKDTPSSRKPQREDPP